MSENAYQKAKDDLASIDQALIKAEEDFDMGRLIDMNQITIRVEAFCEVLKTFPAEECREFLDGLTSLIQRFDQFSEKYERIFMEPDELNARAHKAYTNPLK